MSSRSLRRSYWAVVSYQPREVVVAGMMAAHVSCAVSPLHDSDEWRSDDLYSWIRHRPKGSTVVCLDGSRVSVGKFSIDKVGSAQYVEIPGGSVQDVPELCSKKKAHVHVLLHYSSPMVLENVLSSLDGYLPDVVYAEPVGSASAYFRYLTHEDSPDKYHYDSRDVICIGDVVSSLGDTPDDVQAVSDRILGYIFDYNKRIAEEGKIDSLSFIGLCRHFREESDTHALAEIRSHSYYYSRFF